MTSSGLETRRGRGSGSHGRGASAAKSGNHELRDGVEGGDASLSLTGSLVAFA